MTKIKNIVVFCFVLLCLHSAIQAQDSHKLTPAVLDVKNEKPVIVNRNVMYAKYILDGDSVSIAALYASDGKLGCKKGAEILSSVGSWIRNSIKNDSRHVTFNTVTLNSDDDLLLETGIAEGGTTKVN